jgi:hypothetical protein
MRFFFLSINQSIPINMKKTILMSASVLMIASAFATDLTELQAKREAQRTHNLQPVIHREVQQPQRNSVFSRNEQQRPDRKLEFGIAPCESEAPNTKEAFIQYMESFKPDFSKAEGFKRTPVAKNARTQSFTHKLDSLHLIQDHTGRLVERGYLFYNDLFQPTVFRAVDGNTRVLREETVHEYDSEGVHLSTIKRRVYAEFGGLIDGDKLVYHYNNSTGLLDSISEYFWNHSVLNWDSDGWILNIRRYYSDHHATGTPRKEYIWGRLVPTDSTEWIIPGFYLLMRAYAEFDDLGRPINQYNYSFGWLVDRQFWVGGDSSQLEYIDDTRILKASTYSRWWDKEGRFASRLKREYKFAEGTLDRESPLVIEIAASYWNRDSNAWVGDYEETDYSNTVWRNSVEQFFYQPFDAEFPFRPMGETAKMLVDGVWKDFYKTTIEWTLVDGTGGKEWQMNYELEFLITIDAINEGEIQQREVIRYRTGTDGSNTLDYTYKEVTNPVAGYGTRETQTFNADGFMTGVVEHRSDGSEWYPYARMEIDRNNRNEPLTSRHYEPNDKNEFERRVTWYYTHQNGVNTGRYSHCASDDSYFTGWRIEVMDFNVRLETLAIWDGFYRNQRMIGNPYLWTHQISEHRGYDGRMSCNPNQMSPTAPPTSIILTKFFWSTIGGGTSIVDRNVTNADENSRAVTVFPNPVKDVLNIQTEQTVQQVLVFNMNGQIVWSVSGDQRTVNLQSLPFGVSVGQVQTDKAVVPIRVIRQ